MHLSSDVTLAEANAIYTRMCYKTPDISLLYVTPEKVRLSSEIWIISCVYYICFMQEPLAPTLALQAMQDCSVLFEYNMFYNMFI